MMHCQHENVIVGVEFEELTAEQSVLGEVERLIHQLSCTVPRLREIDHLRRKPHGPWRIDELNSGAIVHREPGSQGFVTPHDFCERRR
jgi:hypothetical protein